MRFSPFFSILFLTLIVSCQSAQQADISDVEREHHKPIFKRVSIKPQFFKSKSGCPKGQIRIIIIWTIFLGRLKIVIRVTGACADPKTAKAKAKMYVKCSKKAVKKCSPKGSDAQKISCARSGIVGCSGGASVVVL